MKIFWKYASKSSSVSGSSPFIHSNANVERLVNQLNVLKSQMCNRMLIGTVKAIYVIWSEFHCLGKCCNYESLRSVLELADKMTTYKNN
jgi:hypothetical protein